jgi:uncharacterized alpha-E superfamily protein
MLSKVAERVYWTARYIERIESTARMISIYDKLLFDLPRVVKITWYNLIVINSLESDFSDRYSVRDERNVVKFLIADDNNPGSIVSSLTAIRENIRTTRDVVLEETWEQVNELHMMVTHHLKDGVNRSSRHEFLESIIKGCHQIQGLLYGNMPQDAAWDFLSIGRSLERADMTTRNLDAAMAAVIDLEGDENAINSEQIIWGNSLRSLNSGQSYQRTIRASVYSKLVVDYLINNEQLPRSIDFCLSSMHGSASNLPKSKKVIATIKKLQKNACIDITDELLGDPLREHLNDIQVSLNELHLLISQTWFPTVE